MSIAFRGMYVTKHIENCSSAWRDGNTSKEGWGGHGSWENGNGKEKTVNLDVSNMGMLDVVECDVVWLSVFVFVFVLIERFLHRWS